MSFFKADHDFDFNKRNMETYGDNILVFAGRYFDTGIYTLDIEDSLHPRLLENYHTRRYEGSSLGLRVASDGIAFIGQGLI